MASTSVARRPEAGEGGLKRNAIRYISNVVIGVTRSGSSVRACFSLMTLDAATDIALVIGPSTSITRKYWNT